MVGPEQLADPQFYRASVTGAVNLGGAALNVDLEDDYPNFYNAPPGDRLYLIQNDGTDPVSGTFRGLPEGGLAWYEGRLFRITYRGGDGNDVELAIVPPAGFDYDQPGQPVRVTFAPGSVPPSVGVDDLTLRNLTTGQTVPNAAMQGAYDPSTGTATWMFPGLPGGRLPDGNYRATVDPAGPVGPLTFDFFVLAGDINRDRSVNGGDFAILARNFGSGRTYSTGDLNVDGRVDGSDFSVLAGNFGKTLPPPPPPAASVAAATAAPAATAPATVPATPPRRAAPVPVAIRRNVTAPTRRGIDTTLRRHAAL